MNKGELFMIEKDMVEQNNVANQYPEIVAFLDSLIQDFQKMRPDVEVEIQPEGWLPPKNWIMPE